MGWWYFLNSVGVLLNRTKSASNLTENEAESA